MWLQFLTGETTTAINRSFVDFQSNSITAQELDFHSDVSGAKHLGIGAIFENSWMFQMWELHFIKIYQPSIEFLELYAVAAAILKWSHQLSNLRVVIFCDNLSVVWMINAANCPRCVNLLRIITFKALQTNTRYFAKHVIGSQNVLADLLGRNQITKFRQLAPSTINDELDSIPDEIWPASKLFNIINSHDYLKLFRISKKKRHKKRR